MSQDARHSCSAKDTIAFAEPHSSELSSEDRNDVALEAASSSPVWDPYLLLLPLAATGELLTRLVPRDGTWFSMAIETVSLFCILTLVLGGVRLIYASSTDRMVHRMALGSGGMFLTYNLLNYFDKWPALRGVALLDARNPVHNALENLTELGGVTLLLVAFCLAIREATATRARLVRERRDLASEVAERHRVERALRESEERYRLSFDGIQEGIAFYGLDMRPMFFNRPAADLVGYSPEELMRMDGRDLVPPEDWEMLVENHRKRILGEPVPRSYELRLVHRDGHVIPVEGCFDLIRRDGVAIGIQGIYRDITERVKAQEALRESKEHYRQLFEGISDCVYVIAADGRILTANERVEPQLGYSHEELLRLTYSDICAGKDREVSGVRIRSVLEHGEGRWESIRVRKDGGTFPVDVSAQRIQFQGQPAVMLISRDNTDRKRTEEALEALARGVSAGSGAEFFEQMVRNLAVALEVECALIATLDESNPDLAHSLTVHLSGEPGCSFTYQLQDTPCALAIEKEAYIHSENVAAAFPLDKRLARVSAECYMGARLTSSSGKPIGVLAAVGRGKLKNSKSAESLVRVFAARASAELERMRSAEALRMSEERLRTLFEGIDDALCVHDDEGRLMDCNAAACRRLGYARCELLSMRIQDIEKRPAKDGVLRRMAELVERGSLIFESEYVTHNGDVIPVDIHASRIEYSGRQAVLVVARDITERRRAEDERERLQAQIQQAQKLESLGILAGGIAHDFNNLLMGVLGNASLALMELPETSPARESLVQIEVAAQRAAELSKQMLAYSGKGKFIIQPVNLSALVEDMVHLLESSTPKKAVISCELAGEPPFIEADPSQLRQVIVNLVTNASDALGDMSGKIVVRTGTRHISRTDLKQVYIDEDLPEGRYAFLEVSDTGCGMDADTIAKVFDPFFSTKFTGRGLGLAAVLGIVRGHKGAISVSSALHKGSTFTVFFPLLERRPALVPQIRRAPAAWTSSGTVLLVDDEETVRTVTRRVLERAGFRVLLANDGMEGVEMFREHASELTLVLLDMTMPRMNGEQAFKLMKDVRSDVPVILSSGYNEPEALDHFAAEGLAGFIQKPYRAEELLQKMRSVLEVCRA